MSTIDCLYCGDPCEILPNGAYCGDCSQYAELQENGRWKVYIPWQHVPCLFWVTARLEPIDLTGYQGTPRQEYVDLFRELGETLHVMTRQEPR